MAKSTAAETAKRIALILRLLSEGSSRPDILEYVGKNWGCSRSTADTLIAKASEIFKVNIEKDEAAIIAEFNRRVDEIYNKALKARQYNVALCAAKEKADRLLGKPLQSARHSGSVTVQVIPDKYECPEDFSSETADGADPGTALA